MNHFTNRTLISLALYIVKIKGPLILPFLHPFTSIFPLSSLVFGKSSSCWSPQKILSLKNENFAVHLSMDLHILYPLINDSLALSHTMIGLYLLYANIQNGILNANIGPITDPIIHKIQGPVMIEHQSRT